MVLLLSEDEVSSLLTYDDSIQVIEEMFRSFSAGRTVLIPRIPIDSPGLKGGIRVMPAAVPDLNTVGLKTISGVPGSRLPGLTFFVILLYDGKEGNLLSVVGGDNITRMRTGAASAVATKYLSRPESSVLALIGAGIQGESQVKSILRVRNVSEIRLFDTNQSQCFLLKEKFERDLDSDVIICNDAQFATKRADIIVTATSSKKPILFRPQIKPGVHINAIGANSLDKQEIDPQIYKDGKIILDFKDQVLREAGDLVAAIKSKYIEEGQIYAELGNIVAGKIPGRLNESEMTIFKSVGIAIEDISIAAKVYSKALESNKGTDISL